MSLHVRHLDTVATTANRVRCNGLREQAQAGEHAIVVLVSAHHGYVASNNANLIGCARNVAFVLGVRNAAGVKNILERLTLRQNPIRKICPRVFRRHEVLVFNCPGQRIGRPASSLHESTGLDVVFQRNGVVEGQNRACATVLHIVEGVLNFFPHPVVSEPARGDEDRSGLFRQIGAVSILRTLQIRYLPHNLKRLQDRTNNAALNQAALLVDHDRTSTAAGVLTGRHDSDRRAIVEVHRNIRLIVRDLANLGRQRRRLVHQLHANLLCDDIFGLPLGARHDNNHGLRVEDRLAACKHGQYIGLSCRARRNTHELCRNIEQV